MKNVLIPTDFSKDSWNAIEYALKFFENATCNFFFLHVIRQDNFTSEESLVFPNSNVAEKTYLKTPIKKLQNIVQKIRRTNNNEKHRLFSLTDYGYFVDSVRKHVIEKKIDFIVMGTKGATGLKKLLIGSNTADIITKVKCTTLVIPENAKFKAPNEIAFPTDFSIFYPTDSLQPLLEILETYKSAIRVLHVKNKKNEQLTYEQIANKEYLKDYFNRNSLSFHYLTNRHLDDAIQSFVMSKDIQMIVMVAKNLNYFQQILFKPAVEEVTYHTEIPFLVLHE